MAERYRHNRQAARRQPLGEIRTGANTPSAPARQMKNLKAASLSPQPQHLPHNESLEPNGSLNVRASQASSPEHKRVSQIASKYERDSKRNSAISTASTTASGQKRKTYIGHWQLGKTIGKGGCSRVRIVRHRFRDQLGAVKIVTRSTAESTRAQSLANLIESTKGHATFSPSGHKPIPFGLEREIAVMKLMEHPNIVRLYDVWENRNELYLIMEYVDGGELFHYVDERKGLEENEAVYIFRQIVSALLYCHRLLICHRDLKPENILLNKEDLTVKLIDFGMAGLQPKGRLLSTPCGSPHYAAPEVVSSKPYDGTQADVWSSGVILYVMLTGTTPFNYSADGDIRVLFRDIARARYWMPPTLSPEAKDLIQRIFVPDPSTRISMDEIWEHPLLRKYDKEWGFGGKAGSKDTAIGPAPTLDQWKIRRVQDIDREILGNMRTLWHSDSEQTLIQKLLNSEINQEKLFYAALIKHREEQFENYVGNMDDMDYSASDYHHSQPPEASQAPPMPGAPRSQSQYSIMNDEHLRPNPSFTEPPPSVSSYDPYRASKNPIVTGRGEYVNVTVHRRGSAGTRRGSTHRHLRHPNGLRIEMLKQHSARRSSHRSSSSLTRSHRSRVSMQRSSASRNSMTSSMWPSSPPAIATMRPSDLHKRGVSFGHLRRTSTTSVLNSQTSTKATPATPRLPINARDLKTLRALEAGTPGPANSPTVQAVQAIRSRKEKATAIDVPRIKVRKPDSSHQHMRSEIRKHSAELEKACEEAFFRSSVGSGLTAATVNTTSDRCSAPDTPPSSVSAPGSASSQQPLARKPTVSRPLPEVPKDTPNTYLTRMLEETREKLVAYKPLDDAHRFDDVINMLEELMPTGITPPPPEKRVFTAPEARTPDHLTGFLPMISEESDNQRSSREGTLNWHRSVTAPLPRQRRAEDNSVRVVPPSSPGTVAPLNVRKRSNGSETSDETFRRLAAQDSAGRLTHKRTMENIGGLTAIDENSTLPGTPTLVRKKRSGWFGLAKKIDVTDEPATPKADLPDVHRLQKRPSRLVISDKVLPDDPPQSGVSSEFPLRKTRFRGGKAGFGKWLGRKLGEKQQSEASEIMLGDTTLYDTTEVTRNDRTREEDSLFSSNSATASSTDGAPVPDGQERSWFARFFNIKPIAKVICFSIPRGRARQELVLLLRAWQEHGIRDLQYSRETNTISARVDRQNTLGIKPISFRIEMFVVLEHGRKVGLSIARFVQVKGAASAFRRVLEVVHGSMDGRGWLVKEEEKWRALSEVVGV
ncbi:serine/threonine-protein kinase gin4 [Recurvomyces mirabilis]|uniref:non-specific serine/threonine protein kinase n=1 Tax=Recurvomyces mirabilis TaxID=574656 RepID=A0AAE0WFN3_9PEZI|nr:serine/threonine-protein kinase gin4 [Recurvomyces mirabilis]KAK5153472.1 serine/threonine-protein kinase gin4 [Recurvomyces mirabilis]